MNRKWVAGLAVLAAVLGCCVSLADLSASLSTDLSTDIPSGASAGIQAEDLTVLPVAVLKTGLANGDISATALVRAYLERIARLDDDGPRLNAVIEINPDAMAIAARLDQARADGQVVGPLHGIPVLLKANIDTGDRLATTAGSRALAGHRAREDAFHVERLRASGAVILGKTNMSEWANFRSTTSVSGWSSLGGQTKNPYATDRNPCGSSSGSAVAVAARLAPLAVGTETDGSIVCPAGVNGIVGIKPSIGLVSRSGIIPIAHTQDTAGPMARSVYGAALALDAMVGLKPGEESAPAESVAAQSSYLPDLGNKDLEGIRLGVWRGYFGADNRTVRDVFDASLHALASRGAALLDPLEIELPENLGRNEFEVLLYEFKAGLRDYLATHDVDPAVDTLAEIIAFNEAHADEVMPIFDQDILRMAERAGSLDDPAYLHALERSHGAMRKLMEDVLAAHDLDAVVAPVNGPAWKTDWVNGDAFGLSSSRLAAVSGFPSVAVPAGFVDGLPIGIAFIGAPFTERNLIQIAYVFEQATQARREPRFLPRAAVEETL